MAQNREEGQSTAMRRAPTKAYDKAYFDRLDGCPIQGGVLAPLRGRF